MKQFLEGGMKNFVFQNRVLQRDRVLERRILEREYCMLNKELKLWGSVQTSSTTVEDTSYLLIHDFIYNIIHDFIYKACANTETAKIKLGSLYINRVNIECIR